MDEEQSYFIRLRKGDEWLTVLIDAYSSFEAGQRALERFSGYRLESITKRMKH